jgi:hypothetical protein
MPQDSNTESIDERRMADVDLVPAPRNMLGCGPQARSSNESEHKIGRYKLKKNEV